MKKSNLNFFILILTTIILIVIILTIFLIMLVKNRKDAKNEKNEKYEKENTINISSDAGFSNRLRFIFGMIKSKSKNKIKIYWDSNQFCNGNFNDIFEPIENVEFIENAKYKPKLDYTGSQPYQNVLKMFNVSYSAKEHKEVYQKLKLKKNLNDIVNNFIKKHNLENGISLHIRRTDHSDLAKSKNNYSADKDFHDYIDKFPKNTPIFLATDNSKTQNNFIKKYGNRLFVYKRIVDNNNLRKTSLEDSAMDIFIASRIKNFKGSKYSSYSELIEILKV